MAGNAKEGMFAVNNDPMGQIDILTSIDCQKVSSTAAVSGTLYWSYPRLLFGIVACAFFTDNTLLKITV